MDGYRWQIIHYREIRASRVGIIVKSLYQASDPDSVV